MATNEINPENVSVASMTVASGPHIHTPLELFQILVGIHTPRSLTQDVCDTEANRARNSHAQPLYVRSHRGNVGLYHRAKDEERRSRIAYILTSYISNFLFMLQILLAATFTALSAYKDSNAVTLTVLGALNTVVAGSLAWQKGQGVPQRYRKAMDQYQALLLEIEMTERSFVDMDSSNNSAGALDPIVEMARLQKLFDTAKADQQANYPDLYVSTSAAASHETKDLAQQLEDVKAAATKTQADIVKRLEGLMERLEAKGDPGINDREAKVEKAVQEVLKI
ncbi:uncharacterized protein MYCFIDRAFT_84385 [Pseudocercospora fijiensis CIRAD86]|uniref:SMODS and SLOG-associating 2TM effector domain-containing protein n=1 Tax=Pseudocercospora fijiensis (strain CIRAD86) TaxID=383855 RepID=M3AJ84_PSEFD|nr:uncharacterized protein MYCFIDRAFT_84385 [Pseudocercospora fijiensis CIRAD86]EME77547.1 hypothetical protein MYCFIDRAFT_84385 [Pseudocercospora fijiensis CIRAD86]